MKAPPYEIYIGADNKIACAPRGGHGRFKQRTVLEWAGSGYTLKFYTFDSNKLMPAAPFDGFPDTVPTPFVGTLTAIPAGQDAPAYSYSISKPGVQTLDPIIVVDK